MDIQHILVQLDAADRFIEEIESEMEVTLTHPVAPGSLDEGSGDHHYVAGKHRRGGETSRSSGPSPEIMKLAGLNLYER